MENALFLATGKSAFRAKYEARIDRSISCLSNLDVVLLGRFILFTILSLATSNNPTPSGRLLFRCCLYFLPQTTIT